MYYSGFKSGHLTRTDRQFGMVKIKRDRFVSRHGGLQPAIVRTKPIRLPASLQSITINITGRLRVQVTDILGVPIPGFSYAECVPINGDYLDAPLLGAMSTASLAGKSVRFEFELTNADLWAFYLK